MVSVFRHFVPGTYVVLALIELVILFVAVYLGDELRKVISPAFGPGMEEDLLWYRAMLYALAISSSMMSMGLYWRQRKASEWWGFALHLGASFLIGIMLLSVIFYAFSALEIDKVVIGYALVISVVSISVIRYFHYHLSDHELMKRRIIVLGTGKQASLMEKMRRKSDRYGFRIVGYIQLHGENNVIDDLKVLPSIKSLKSAVEEYQIDEIVVALDDRRKNFPVDEILDCKMEGITVREIGTFLEYQTEKISLDTLHPSNMIFSVGFNRAIQSIYRKRLFDITVSLMMLFAVWPLMLLTAIAILIESGGSGPVFYRQVRVGKNGKHFQLLKFRSMHVDAEKDGEPQWAQKNDKRITKVGRIIRMSRIDEMPQLVNVLRGEMSFVGPRPERPQFVEELSQVVPFYALRNKVNPGITGWAQISYPYGATKQDVIEKLQYDLYYIKHYRVMFDLMVLFQTAQVILFGKGAR